MRILHWCNKQSIARTLEDTGLTPAQGHLIGYLASRQEAPPCPKDIETDFQLSHPTVSGLLTRLEQKGFLEFQPDPFDRRSKRVLLLPKGIQFHQRIHQAIQENEQRMLDGFTPEERAAFCAYLNRAIRNMGGAPSQNPEKEDSQK